MSNKPFVNLIEAVGWVCLDCGHKNYTDLIPVEDPDQLAVLRAQLNADENSVVTGVPVEVECSKCGKEWRTSENQPDVFHQLNHLLEALDLIDVAEGEDFDAAIADIVDNAGIYSAALAAILDSLNELEVDEDD